MGYKSGEEGIKLVYYLIIALVIIVIGVAYIGGADLIKIIRGKNPFAAPNIEITDGDEPFDHPQTANFFTFGPAGYTVTMNALKIDYSDGREEDTEIYPILDFGDNPLLDDSARSITCKFDDTLDIYNCGDPIMIGTVRVPLVFNLKPEKIQNFDSIGKTIFVQIYFFKKTDAIRQYIENKEGGYGRTTTNLLLTYNDFYIYNQGLGIVDTSSGAGTTAALYCATKTKKDCDKNQDCYWSNSCVPCKVSNNCEDYSELECQKCRLAKQKNCRWVQTGTIRGEPQFRCRGR